jgi:hypothetical protein
MIACLRNTPLTTHKTHSEERAHGVTMEIGHKRIELPHRVITLLDAPGHQDFIPQVIDLVICGCVFYGRVACTCVCGVRFGRLLRFELLSIARGKST